MNDVRKAQRQASAKMSFVIHLCVYAIVNIVLAVINLVASPDYLWFVWPLLGWGIGLACHGLAIFLFVGNDSVHQKMVDQELKRNQSK